MKVAVNLLWCRPGRVGGSEEYLARQLDGLARVAPEIELSLFTGRDWPSAHPQLADRVAATCNWAGSRPARLVAEAMWLRHRSRAADLVHHGGGTVPPAARRPHVVTVHDLQYRSFPHYFSPLRRRYLDTMLPRSVRHAAVVTVPSEYVASTVVEAFGVAADRVVVVPHGIEPPTAPLPDAADLRRRYALGARRLVVFPAITHRHKGHRFLLDVAATRWPDDVAIVLLGGAGAADDDVAAAIDELHLGARVIRPGRVPSADRDGLIAIAEALVFPSEYEGFGAPVIEAMTVGTPVISSDRAALPEVVGDGGLVLPLERDAWGGALDTIAADRPHWIAAARRRAAAFTIEQSGAALATAYRRGTDR